MSKVYVKMGDGIESNCFLSGTPVKAGGVAEISQSDAKYVLSAKLGRYANGEEMAEFLKANGREKEIPKPKGEKKADKPIRKADKAPKVDDPNPEPKKAEKPKKEADEKTVDEMGFGELKAEAERLGIKITKSKGRITKADFINAIKSKQKGK